MPLSDKTLRCINPYEAWSRDVASRPGSDLRVLEFDLEKYPYQAFEINKVEPLEEKRRMPDMLYYGTIDYVLGRSLGMRAYWTALQTLRRQRSDERDDRSVAKRLYENQLEGKNTLVVTPHMTLDELGYVRALCTRAKRDKAVVEKDGVVVNKLMSRQAYKDRPLMDLLTYVGNVRFSYPVSDNAVKFGVPSDIMREGNVAFIRTLTRDLRAGGQELHVALSGAQVKKRENNGELHYEIPQITPASVSLASRFDEIVGINLVRSPISNKTEIAVTDVKKISEYSSAGEVVDDIYGQMRGSLEESLGARVVYHTTTEV